MYNGMRIYRGIVHYSSTTSGDIHVKIPSILGANETVSISRLGRNPVEGTWDVPDIGTQVLVALEDERLSNVYLLNIYPKSV